MAKTEAVAEFLIGFAAACELLGYPSWVDRELLRLHVATTEFILDGTSPTAEELREMTEFVESLREAMLARGSAQS